MPAIFIGGKYVGGYEDGPSEDAPGLLSLAFTGKSWNSLSLIAIFIILLFYNHYIYFLNLGKLIPMLKLAGALDDKKVLVVVEEEVLEIKTVDEEANKENDDKQLEILENDGIVDV